MSNRMKNWLTSGLATTALLGFAFTASAQVPTTIQYQGKLMTTADEMAFEGTGDMEVKFGTEDASTVTYEETIEDVAIANGLFSVTIGESNAIPVEAFTTPSLFLHLTFTPDGGTAEVFAPVPLSSMPYAHVAASAASVAAGTALADTIASLEDFQTNSSPSFIGQTSYGVLEGTDVTINLLDLFANGETAQVTSRPSGVGSSAVNGTTISYETPDVGSSPVTQTFVVSVANAAGSTEQSFDLVVGSFEIDDTPDDVDIFAGNSASFAYDVDTNIPGIQYRWQLDGENYSSPADAPSLTVDPATSDDEGDFRAVALLPFGQTFNLENPPDAVTGGGDDATLSIDSGFEFDTQPDTEEVFAGGPATFFANARPTDAQFLGTIVYDWLKYNGTTKKFEIVEEGGDGVFSFIQAVEGNGGQYRVDARTEFFTIESDPFNLIVNDNITITGPNNPTQTASLNTVLSAVGDLTNDIGEISYQWFRRPDPNDTDDDFAISGATGPNLIFTDVTESEAGEYYVRISSGFSTRTSDVGNLTVNRDVAIENDLPDTAGGIVGDVIDIQIDTYIVTNDGRVNVTRDGDGNVTSIGTPSRSATVEWYRVVDEIGGPSSGNAADELIVSGSLAGTVNITEFFLGGVDNLVSTNGDPISNGLRVQRNRLRFDPAVLFNSDDTVDNSEQFYARISTIDPDTGDVYSNPFRSNVVTVTIDPSNNE